MSATAPGNPVVHLTIRRGPRIGQTFSAEGPSVVIGRVPGNDIIIDDAQVSRHHASLNLEGGQWVLRDLASTNGTFINGQPLGTQSVVREGDVIGLGDVLVAVQFAALGGAGGSTLAGARPAGVGSAPMAADGGGRSWALPAIVAVLLILALGVTAVLLLVVFRPAAAGPQVVISAPASGVLVDPGSVVEVQVLATDAQGVTRVDLVADNVLVATQSAPDARGVTPFAAILRWPAGAPGPHTLVVNAFNAGGQASQPAIVLVNVASAPGAGGTVTPTGVAPGTGAPATPTSGTTGLPPTSTPTLPPPPTAQPTATLPPLPTTCLDDATFVADVTVPDGTVVAPAQRVDKVWRLRNSGTCRWGAGYGVAYVSGSQLSGPPLVTMPDTPPGATMDIGVTLYAPSTPGTYTGHWQLRNAGGALFGRPFLVQIVVPAPATATPPPTPQSSISFSADRTDIQPGECVTLRWDVENVSAVYLEGDGVVGHGSRSVCPSVTSSYTLRVVRLDGGSEDRRITINVTAPAELAKPERTNPGDGSVFDRYPRTADFQWLPQSYPGGVSYTIEIQWATPAGEDWQMWQMVVSLPEPAYHMDDFVGAYNLGRWRVWAVSNATGQLGPKTSWWTFQFTQ